MEITSRLINGVLTISPARRFDAYNAPQVRDIIQQALHDGQIRIVVNMRHVTFIDSTALGVLVQGMKRCRQQQGDLRICGVQQSVRVIFELTRLDRVFTQFVNEPDALQTAW